MFFDVYPTVNIPPKPQDEGVKTLESLARKIALECRFANLTDTPHADGLLGIKDCDALVNDYLAHFPCSSPTMSRNR